jgi:uncharacterized protein YuzE
MKLSYDPTTDSLYIHLQDKSSVDSREISDGVLLDFDENGAVIGLDIQHASKVADLEALTAINIPYSLE